MQKSSTKYQQSEFSNVKRIIHHDPVGFIPQNASVGLKQTDYQIFLQEIWIYSGSAENCNSASATMVSHMQVHTRQGKEKALIRRKKKVRRAIVNKESMAFHCLTPCQKKKGVFLLPVELGYCHKA